MGLFDVIRGINKHSSPHPAPIRIDPHNKKIVLVSLGSTLAETILLGPLIQALINSGVKPPVGLVLKATPSKIWKHLDLPVKLHILEDILTSSEPQDPEELEAARLKLSVSLKRRNYHIAADLTPNAELDPRVWLEQSTAPLRLGFLRPGEIEAPELTWAAPYKSQPHNEHWTRYISSPLEPLSIGRIPHQIPLKTTDSAHQKSDQLFDLSPRVLIIPGSDDLTKRLPPECFITAGRLATRRGGSVVVAGAPEERAHIKNIAHSIGLGAQTYSSKSLGPLVGLIQAADIVVTRDTGPMHLAFLSGTRTVALFTYRSSLSWGPMVPGTNFSLLNVPHDSAEAARPVIEQLIINQLGRHIRELSTSTDSV